MLEIKSLEYITKNVSSHLILCAEAAARKKLNPRGSARAANLFLQARAETGEPSDAFLNDVVTRRIAEAQITFGAESAARDRGDFFLIEQAIAEFDIAQTKTGNIRKKIKCTFGK